MATQRPSQPKHGSHFAAQPQQTKRPQRQATSRRTSQRSNPARRTRVNTRRQPKQSNNKAIVIIILLMVIAGCAFAFFKFKGGFDSQEIDKGQQVTVTIAEGSGAKAMADTLYEAKVIESKNSFVDLVKKKGVSEKLKPGNYSFITGQDIDAIIEQLIEGPNSDIDKVTFAEGLTVDRTAEVVEQKFGISKDDFLKQAKASNYVGEYPFLKRAYDDSLEGFLYPKTYDFTGMEVSADSIIRAMLNQYQKEVSGIDFNDASKRMKEAYGVDFDEYDFITLASIIERESLTQQDRENVASTFYNRFKSGMALQSDATMGYVVSGEVTPDDLQKESPYNTYKNEGLTPSPICNPSIECINVAINPPNTNYLYFFIKDGANYSSHTFSETYEQHQAAIQDYMDKNK